MSNLKKYTLGLVAASTLLFVACGNGEEDDNGTGNDDEISTIDTDNLDGTIEVGVSNDYVPIMEELAPLFEEEYGVEVVVTERDMFDTLEALPMDGPAQLAPDVMLSPYDRIGGLGQQGHLAPLTLPDDGRYDEIDEMQVTVDDSVYALPYVIESLVLYYNRELIDEAPTTFEELEALTEDETYDFSGEAGTSTAFLANWVDFYNSYGLLSGYGGYVFGDDGEDPSDVGLNTDGAIEAIEYAQYWFDEIWPEGMLDVTSAGNFIDDQFIQGNTAAIINGPWGAENYRDSGVDYGVTMIPTLPNGSEYEPFAGGKGWIVPAYTDNFEAAQAFVEFVTNEENSTLLYEDFTFEIPANQDSRTAIIDDGEDELAVAVIEQYNVAVPMPNIPEMAEVWSGAETMMFDAGSGNKTAEQSANDAVDLISENIEQIY